MYIVKNNDGHYNSFENFDDAMKFFKHITKVWNKPYTCIIDDRINSINKTILIHEAPHESKSFTVWVGENSKIIGTFPGIESCINAMKIDMNVDLSPENRYFVVKDDSGARVGIYIVEDKKLKKLNRFIIMCEDDIGFYPITYANSVDEVNEKIIKLIKKNKDGKYFILDRMSEGTSLSSIFDNSVQSQAYCNKDIEKLEVVYPKEEKSESEKEVKEKMSDKKFTNVLAYCVVKTAQASIERDMEYFKQTIESKMTKYLHADERELDIQYIVLKEFFKDQDDNLILRKSVYKYMTYSKDYEGGMDKYYKVAEHAFSLRTSENVEI